MERFTFVWTCILQTQQAVRSFLVLTSSCPVHPEEVKWHLQFRRQRIQQWCLSGSTAPVICIKVLYLQCLLPARHEQIIFWTTWYKIELLFKSCLVIPPHMRWHRCAINNREHLRRSHGHRLTASSAWLIHEGTGNLAICSRKKHYLMTILVSLPYEFSMKKKDTAVALPILVANTIFHFYKLLSQVNFMQTIFPSGLIPGVD